MMIAFSLRVGWGDLELEDGLVQSYRNRLVQTSTDPRSVNVRDCVSSQSRTDCDAENLGSATICHRFPI